MAVQANRHTFTKNMIDRYSIYHILSMRDEASFGNRLLGFAGGLMYSADAS